VTKQVGYWTQEEDLQSKHNWPRQRGFDEFFGTIHGAGSFWDPITLTRDNTPIRAEGDEFHYTDAIADNGVNFIEEYAAQDAPFFLYLPFTSPHWPLHAFEEDIARYENTYDIGYDKLRDNRRQRMIEMGIINADWPLTPRDDRVEPWEDRPNKEWEARRMAVYAAQITQMDRAIGRVVDKLKELQILDNTLIMFLADNGGCAEILRDNGNPRAIHTPYRTRDGRTVRFGNDPDIMPGPTDTYQSYGPPWANASNTPFRLYKHWVHEGGIATPLIVHWPAQLKGAGSLNEGPGHLIDIMATCIDAAGAEYPATYKGNAITPLEGKSLLPVVTTGERQGHDAIYWEHEGNRAVRQGDWKLVARNRNEWELYNINEDRTEMNNLASQQPDKVRELTALYEAYAARSQVVDYDTMRKRAQGQTY